jgi:DNA-binding HxlR family transcriptional regulator
MEDRTHESDIKDLSMSEDELFKAMRSYDLWDALRKFANKDITLIARLLYSNGPQTLGDLRDKTGLPTNKLNHDLTEMRSVDLVQKIEKKYYLTKYAAVLLDILDRMKNEIRTKDDLITPFLGEISKQL